jgi:hypothetical protein
MTAKRATGGLVILACLANAACGGLGGSGCGPNPQFGLLCCPSCPQSVPRACAEIPASQLFWHITGFHSSEILDPDRFHVELTAILHAGDAKRLEVRASTNETLEDCTGKNTTVEWSVSNAAVARLDVQENPRVALLVTVQPGDTNVSAVLQFADGTPSMRVLPWSSTNVGSGDITVIRVVP